jgi:hypothetical protein
LRHPCLLMTVLLYALQADNHYGRQQPNDRMFPTAPHRHQVCKVSPTAQLLHHIYVALILRADTTYIQ